MKTRRAPQDTGACWPRLRQPSSYVYERGCVINSISRQPGTNYRHTLPNRFASSPVATRSSLARAREPASGALTRRAPPREREGLPLRWQSRDRVTCETVSGGRIVLAWVWRACLSFYEERIPAFTPSPECSSGCPPDAVWRPGVNPTTLTQSITDSRPDIPRSPTPLRMFVYIGYV